jgi:opacity protein-like surface antigen
MKLIPMLMVAGALLVTAMPANAQNRRANNDQVADQLNARVLEVLRAGQTPVAPVATVAPTMVTAPAPVASPLTGVYVGANAGSNFRDTTDYQVGGILGYQFNRNLAAELTYDYMQLNNRTDGQMVMGNVVYSRQLGQTALTPYVLVGTGMGWNALGVRNTGSNLALYNVGGGVRLNLVRNVDLDARYRYVGAFDDSLNGNYHAVTGGLNYRF